MSPSPSISCRTACTGEASVPVLPKRIVEASTVVASKESVVRIATGMTPRLRGLGLFGKLPGLMLISTVAALHFPAPPALKMAWISEAERAIVNLNFVNEPFEISCSDDERFVGSSILRADSKEAGATHRRNVSHLGRLCPQLSIDVEFHAEAIVHACNMMPIARSDREPTACQV